MKKLILLLFSVLALRTQAQITKTQAKYSVDSLLPSSSAVRISEVRKAFEKTLNYTQSVLDTKTGFFSMAQIRAFNAEKVSLNPRIYMTDEGREGFWHHNPSGSGGDNTGTRLVTANGAYYYREHDNSVKPEWWGAKCGDGIDDSPAINAAILAASKRVALSAGDYEVASPILVNKSEFEFVGAGKFATRIKPLSSFNRVADSCLVRIGSPAFRPANVTLKDMTIAATFASDGNKLNGLVIDADFNTDIYNCWFQGGNYIDREVAGVNIKAAKHLRFTDCNFTNSYSYGLILRGLVLDDMTFIGCAFDENQTDIIVLPGGYMHNCVITSCNFGHSYQPGMVEYNTPYQHTLIRNIISGSIDRLTVANSVFANSFTSPTNSAMDLNGVGHVSISNCKFSAFKRYAVVNRGSGIVDVFDCYFKNNARTRSSNVVTDATSDPYTSPFQTDIFYTTGYYGGIIRNNTSTQTEAIAWIESNISDVQYLNTKIEGNKVYAHKRIFGVIEKATSAPSNVALNYRQGEYVENSNPIEQGTSPNKYLIEGWKCVESGYPGTWVQVRSFTGN